MFLNDGKEREEALRVVSSAIGRCEKIQPKFQMGTPQHSLLKNRLQALRLAQVLLEGGGAETYSREELQAALPPIHSILHKTRAARDKYEEGSSSYRRFGAMIRGMELARQQVEEVLAQREEG